MISRCVSVHFFKIYFSYLLVRIYICSVLWWKSLDWILMTNDPRHDGGKCLPFSFPPQRTQHDRIENCYRSRICNIQLDNVAPSFIQPSRNQVKTKHCNANGVLRTVRGTPMPTCSYIEDNMSKNEDHTYIPNNNTEFSHTYRPSLNSNRRNLTRKRWNT